MHKQKGFTIVEVILIVIVIGVLGALGYVAWNHFHKNTKSMAGGNTVSINQSNQWTGNAHTYDLADAKNWSKGTPTDGQDLTIDAAKVTAPADGTNFFLNNNLTTSIGTLTITGSTKYLSFGFKGNPMRIAGGIVIDARQTTTDAAVLQPNFAAGVVFLKDQTVSISSRNALLDFFDGTDDSTVFDTQGHTIRLVATNDATIDISSEIIGSGTLISNGKTIYVRAPTSRFTGATTVETGTLSVVEEGVLGTGKITVDKGATLSVCKGKSPTNTGTYTLANDISLTGVGAPSQTDNLDGPAPSNATQGALNGGCGYINKVILTGTVSLAGDAELAGLPSNAGFTYPTTFSLVKPLQTNGHNLTATAKTQTVIVKP